MSGKTTFIIEPGKQEIIVTRVFNTSKEKLYKAMIDPDAIVKWWGPSWLTTKVDKMEVKPGGMWRYLQYDKDGNEFGFHGFYHEIIPNERTTSTFEFEGMPGHILMETMKLEEIEGKTKMTSISVFQSVADRDGMVQSGMEKGHRESLDQLAELVEGK